MRIWFSGPRLFNGLVRPGVSFGREDFAPPKIPSWKRFEYRKGLIDEAAAEGRTMTREEADYLIDKSIDTILAAQQAEQAAKRRALWVWAAITWIMVIAAFAFIIIAAHAGELHDGSPCFNDYGEPGTYYGQHCYVDDGD